MTDPRRTQPTVAEQVADRLRSEIQTGKLAAGEPLRQNEVAARLGVSSTPVREAFQILERSGLVGREGRRGVRVFRPSIADLVHGYEVRIALEAMAAGLAAERLSSDARARLVSSVDQMHREPISQEEYLRLNADLHAQIAHGSGNPRLEELIVTEHAATSTFISFLGVDASRAHDADDEHMAIIDAIMRNDAVGAAEAMRLHLRARVDALRIRLAEVHETGTDSRDDLQATV